MGNCSGCQNMKVQTHINFEEEGILTNARVGYGFSSNEDNGDKILDDLLNGKNIEKILFIQRTFKKHLKRFSNEDLNTEKVKSQSKSKVRFNNCNPDIGTNFSNFESEIDPNENLNGLQSKNYLSKMPQGKIENIDESILKQHESINKLVNSKHNTNNIQYNDFIPAISLNRSDVKKLQRLDIKKIKMPNNSYFIGIITDNRAESFGILVHSDGDEYCGFWKTDEANGLGKYISYKGSNYIGYWMKNKRNGYGIEVWPTGTSYEGYFLNGFKDHLGILKFDDGSYYEGEFVTNEISGIGTFYFKDKRIYYGEWKNNKMNGDGIIIWPDGKRYEGSFVNDKKEGFGIFYANSKIYIADWKNSKLDGDVLIIQNRSYSRSYWKFGKKIKSYPENYYHPYDMLAEKILHEGDLY